SSTRPNNSASSTWVFQAPSTAAVLRGWAVDTLAGTAATWRAMVNVSAKETKTGNGASAQSRWIIALGSIPLVRIIPAGTGNSAVRAAPRVAKIASERSPETITSAPSLRTCKKLPPSIDTALTSDTSRSNCSDPATQSNDNDAAISPTVG